MAKDDLTPLSLMALPKSIENRYARNDRGEPIPDNVLQVAHRAGNEAAAYWQQAASTHQQIMDGAFPLSQKIEVSRRAVSNLAAIAGKRLQAALDKIESEVDAIRKGGTWRPPAPTTAHEVAMATEVRAVLRGMDAGARMQLLANAPDDVVVAVLWGSETTTGIKPDQIEATRMVWRKRHHGEAFEREERLIAAHADITRAGDSMAATIDKMFTPHAALLRDAELMKAAAIAAAEAQ